MANTVDFKHFYGRTSKWNEKINSSTWDNAMVFGKIWNGVNWEYKIYAGCVKDGSANNITFLYDIPNAEELKEIENLIHINVDTSTFVNQTFIEAIQHVIDNYVNLDEINNRLDSEIEDVNNKIVDLSTAIYDYIDEHIENIGGTIENINSSIDRIDASVLDLFKSVEDLTGVVEDLANDFADISARVDELENNTVKSVKSLNDYVMVEPSVGHVSIDVSAKDAEDTSKFPSSGFVTDGYVEERLDVFNWVEVENE